ncbi:hypothetical protein Tco_1448287 [Tanacetum coccineum]|uniref:Uncharacterized protein n=1 Tax=Tanacetum coccineum TaxID=301880 RepID=A0ABQ5AIL5_9ASTR
MENFNMMNKPHWKKILHLLKKGPLFGPSITADGSDKAKEYFEITPLEPFKQIATSKQLKQSFRPRPTKLKSMLSEVSTSCSKGEGHIAKQVAASLSGKSDETWFNDKVLLVQAQSSGTTLNRKEEIAFLADSWTP